MINTAFTSVDGRRRAWCEWALRERARRRRPGTGRFSCCTAPGYDHLNVKKLEAQLPQRQRRSAVIIRRSRSFKVTMLVPIECPTADARYLCGVTFKYSWQVFGKKYLNLRQPSGLHVSALRSNHGVYMYWDKSFWVCMTKKSVCLGLCLRSDDSWLTADVGLGMQFFCILCVFSWLLRVWLSIQVQLTAWKESFSKRPCVEWEVWVNDYQVHDVNLLLVNNRFVVFVMFLKMLKL